LDDPGFTRFMRRLGSFCRVITTEPRGFGASGGYGTDLYDPGIADADILAVLDAVSAPQAVLVGWSSAGAHMTHFAATHPHRVKALVLIDSCAHYVREDDYPWGFPRGRLDEITAYIEGAWGSATDLDVTAPSRMGDERLRAWWGRARRSSYMAHSYAEVFRASLEFDVRHLLADISAPTLVLHREGDRFIHLGAGRYLAEHIPGAKFVVLPGEDHLFFAGDSDALLDEIEVFLTGSRFAADASTVTTNILFTDIVGSTEQQARLGQRQWSRLTDEHDAVVREVLVRHRGREVKTTGDGFLAIFDAAGSSLRCATEILAAAKRVGLDLRAGVHTGDVEIRGGDIGGLSVSIAKRVCDLAAPGEVLVSDTVRSVLTGSGIGFSERGQHELKGVPGSWRLYRVVS
jgi:class 3 adenylate cyclase/pimeloyl-ACP methyl ester carboxylesterase